MTTLDIRSPDGQSSGTIELPADVFDAPANLALMHQVVIAQLAAARAGTHSTKTRGEVRGGGAKPYRQKGTGRARQGSTRAPQFEGGGIVHGPKPRDYSQRTPKKMKAAALRAALSDRARDGRLHVVSSFLSSGAPSTREALEVLRAVLADSVVNARRSPRILVVVQPEDSASWKSLRNVSSVHLLDSGQLNTYDVLVSDDVVFTEEALQAFLAGQLQRRAHRRRGGNQPDLTTPEVPGALPSIAPAEGEGQVDVSLTKPSAADSAAKPVGKAAATAADIENHPYGEDSHTALEDDSAPTGYSVKGRAGAKRYVVPTSALFAGTTADVWFASTEAAVEAGFTEGGDE